MSIHSCVPNVVNTVSWKVLDIFTKFSVLVHFWDEDGHFKFWCEKEKGSKFKVTVGQTCFKNSLFGLVNAISDAQNFTRLSMLIHFGTSMNALIFGVTRSKVKVTAWHDQRPSTGPAGGVIQSSMLCVKFWFLVFSHDLISQASWDWEVLLKQLKWKELLLSRWTFMNEKAETNLTVWKIDNLYYCW